MDDLIRALSGGGSAPLTVAVGKVRITPAVANLSASVAVVHGITETPMQVTPESWCSPFKASVTAGSVDDKLVVVLFNAGQPIILCLIGV
jgi:hypothetical protein